MFLQGGELARQEAPWVSRHALALVKDLHGGGRRTGFQFLVDELVGTIPREHSWNPIMVASMLWPDPAATA